MNHDYELFLAEKAVSAPMRGLAKIPDLAPHLFTHQRHSTAHALAAGGAGCFLDTGLGKAHPVDELVLTPIGLVQIGNLQIGDYVVGRDGLPTQVIGVFPQGQRPCYEVEFTDGAKTKCDLDHLWAVRTKVQKFQNKPFKTISLRQILADGLESQEGWRYFVPMCDPVQFDETAIPIDPYALGALIGDGYLSNGGPRISSADAEILEAVAGAMPDGIQLQPYGGYDWGITTGTRNGRTKNPNKVHVALKELGLAGKTAAHKFIPRAYKYGSVNTRIRILQGLLDTDGHIRPTDNNVEFSSTSLTLAEDVVFIVRSLGGRAKIRKHPTQRLMSYRMSICLPDQIVPFALTRKASIYKPRQKYKPTRAICAARYIGEADAVCIKVAAQDSLYLTADCIVTHNTEVQLEFLKHALEATNGRALLLTPLAVAQQTKRRAERWGYEARVIREQSDRRDGINIVNYDRLGKIDAESFGSVSLDEASILKSFTGKTTRALIGSFARHRFKLAATATPAPNDHMELGQYAEFCGLMRSNEMLMRWFVADQTEMGRYRLKGHAESDFWDWMASWSRFAQLPSDLGGDDTGFILPPLKIVRHQAERTAIKVGSGLFGNVNMSATNMHSVKRQTANARADTVGRIIADQPDETWLIWCDTNYEADSLKAAIPDAIEVRGAMGIDQKEELLDAFGTGQAKRLITKPSVAGFGLDWSHCARNVFVGRSYSYEMFYQAIRRTQRYGQKRTVEAHIVIAEGEDVTGANIDRKGADHERMWTAMRSAMKRAMDRDEAVRKAYNPTLKGRFPSWIKSAV